MNGQLMAITLVKLKRQDEVNQILFLKAKANWFLSTKQNKLQQSTQAHLKTIKRMVTGDKQYTISIMKIK